MSEIEKTISKLADAVLKNSENGIKLAGYIKNLADRINKLENKDEKY